MNYPLYLGRKLALGGSGRHSSPGVKVAIVAIALSLAVMTASIAITLGFKREITDKVVGFTSHIMMTLVPIEGDDNMLTLTPTLKSLIEEEPFVADVSLQVSLPTILKTSNDFKGIVLKNLDDKHTRDFIESNLVEGKIPDYSSDTTALEIVLSRLAASRLSLKLGDKVDCYFINDDVKVRRLTISGIYNSHFDAYDDIMVYGSRKLSEIYSGINPNQGTSLLITTEDFNHLDYNTYLLEEKLDNAYKDGLIYRKYIMENAHDSGAGYFHWLAMLDTNVAVVLVLMMIVGCVTLISGMLTIILDKKKFIGLMKALGAPTSKLRMVFVYLAMRVAIIGMLIGNILIISFLWLQNKYHFIRLDASSYYIDFVPVELDWSAFAILNAAVLVIIYLSLIIPGKIIANITPSETMTTE